MTGKLIFENVSVSEVPEDVYDQFFKQHLHTDETLHIYKNNLSEYGWSMTTFSVGDRVKILDPIYKNSSNISSEGTIVDITPATYGMLNIHIRNDDGTETLAYPGDLKRL